MLTHNITDRCAPSSVGSPLRGTRRPVRCRDAHEGRRASCTRSACHGLSGTRCSPASKIRPDGLVELRGVLMRDRSDRRGQPKPPACRPGEKPAYAARMFVLYGEPVGRSDAWYLVDQLRIVGRADGITAAAVIEHALMDEAIGVELTPKQWNAVLSVLDDPPKRLMRLRDALARGQRRHLA